MSTSYVTNGGSVCPVCSATAALRIDVGDYALFECKTCACWSSTAAHRRAESSFVPEKYFAEAEFERSKWEVLRKRLSSAGVDANAVLDVGCGGGEFLAFVRSWLPNARLVGVELDASRAAQARERTPSAVIHQGDALEIARGVQGPFDLITLWDVFEHVKQPAELLQRLAELLSPGGVIYIQTINEHSLLPWLGRASYRLSLKRITFVARRTHEAHHLVFFSAKGIHLLARKSGLKVRNLGYDRLAHERMDGGAVARRVADALLRAEVALGGGLFIDALLQRVSVLNPDVRASSVDKAT